MSPVIFAVLFVASVGVAEGLRLSLSSLAAKAGALPRTLFSSANRLQEGPGISFRQEWSGSSLFDSRLTGATAPLEERELSWSSSYQLAEQLATAQSGLGSNWIARSGSLWSKPSPLSPAMIGSPSVESSSAFVSPEASNPPASCPNAPKMQKKTLRRRPDDDDENDDGFNSQNHVARKLEF